MTKTISIVIPVFNEEKRLSKTFEALRKLALPRGLKSFDVIFVNDGSTDTTLKLVKKFKTQVKFPTTILSYAKNRGKGYAVRKGMLCAKGDYALLCDADMSTPFSELKKFVPYLKKGNEIIIGTRKNGHSTVVVHQPKVRELLGKGFTQFTKAALGLKVTDFTCGFKLFSQKTIGDIFLASRIERWGYDAEIIFLAHKKGFLSAECPVLWSDDKRSHVNVLQAIPQTIWEIAKIRTYHSLIPALQKVTSSKNEYTLESSA